MIRGVDVSAIQGRVDWDALRSAGAEFAWMRGVVGNEYRDARVRENIAEAKRAGVFPGVYCFAFPLPKLTPEAQVDYWVGKFEADGDLPGRAYGELPPALDLEWPPPEEKDKVSGRLIDTWAKWGVTGASILRWGAKALIRMHQHWGCWPALYTYPYFWKRAVAGVSKTELDELLEVYGNCLWWGADYKASGRVPQDGERPFTPAPWNDGRNVFWQHDGNGGLKMPNGVDCDWNVFTGTRDDLANIVRPYTERVVPPGVDMVLVKQRTMGAIVEEDIARYRRERV